MLSFKKYSTIFLYVGYSLEYAWENWKAMFYISVTAGKKNIDVADIIYVFFKYWDSKIYNKKGFDSNNKNKEKLK